MGVIKPPWISEDWFVNYPFNYCDHFGDKDTLAKVCVICRDTCREDHPYDLANNPLNIALQQLIDNILVDRNTSYMPDLPPFRSAPSIYTLVEGYGKAVVETTRKLKDALMKIDKLLLFKTLDVLDHAQHFIQRKILRAFNSKWREMLREMPYSLFDAKTSAFFSYVAIERGCRGLFALAEHKPIREMREKHLAFVQASTVLMEIIKDEFFPEHDKLIYVEFGCESYDECFVSH